MIDPPHISILENLAQWNDTFACKSCNPFADSSCFYGVFGTKQRSDETTTRQTEADWQTNDTFDYASPFPMGLEYEEDPAVTSNTDDAPKHTDRRAMTVRDEVFGANQEGEALHMPSSGEEKEERWHRLDPTIQGKEELSSRSHCPTPTRNRPSLHDEDAKEEKKNKNLEDAASRLLLANQEKARIANQQEKARVQAATDEAERLKWEIEAKIDAEKASGIRSAVAVTFAKLNAEEEGRMKSEREQTKHVRAREEKARIAGEEEARVKDAADEAERLKLKEEADIAAKEEIDKITRAITKEESHRVQGEKEAKIEAEEEKAVYIQAQAEAEAITKAEAEADTKIRAEAEAIADVAAAVQETERLYIIEEETRMKAEQEKRKEEVKKHTLHLQVEEEKARIANEEESRVKDAADEAERLKLGEEAEGASLKQKRKQKRGNTLKYAKVNPTLRRRYQKVSPTFEASRLAQRHRPIVTNTKIPPINTSKSLTASRNRNGDRDTANREKVVNRNNTNTNAKRNKRFVNVKSSGYGSSHKPSKSQRNIKDRKKVENVNNVHKKRNKSFADVKSSGYVSTKRPSKFSAEFRLNQTAVDSRSHDMYLQPRKQTITKNAKIIAKTESKEMYVTASEKSSYPWLINGAKIKAEDGNDIINLPAHEKSGITAREDIVAKTMAGKSIHEEEANTDATKEAKIKRTAEVQLKSLNTERKTRAKTKDGVRVQSGKEKELRKQAKAEAKIAAGKNTKKTIVEEAVHIQIAQGANITAEVEAKANSGVTIDAHEAERLQIVVVEEEAKIKVEKEKIEERETAVRLQAEEENARTEDEKTAEDNTEEENRKGDEEQEISFCPHIEEEASADKEEAIIESAANNEAEYLNIEIGAGIKAKVELDKITKAAAKEKTVHLQVEIEANVKVENEEGMCVRAREEAEVKIAAEEEENAKSSANAERDAPECHKVDEAEKVTRIQAAQEKNITVEAEAKDVDDVASAVEENNTLQIIEDKANAEGDKKKEDSETAVKARIADKEEAMTKSVANDKARHWKLVEEPNIAAEEECSIRLNNGVEIDKHRKRLARKQPQEEAKIIAAKVAGVKSQAIYTVLSDLEIHGGVEKEDYHRYRSILKQHSILCHTPLIDRLMKKNKKEANFAQQQINLIMRKRHHQKSRSNQYSDPVFEHVSVEHEVTKLESHIQP